MKKSLLFMLTCFSLGDAAPACAQDYEDEDANASEQYSEAAAEVVQSAGSCGSLWSSGSSSVAERSSGATKITQGMKLRVDIPMEAPPDCPDCVPDPGGDVTDVPFDRRMLLLLLPGALFVVIKANRKKQID